MSSLLWTILEVSVNFLKLLFTFTFSKIVSIFAKNQSQQILYVLFLTQLFFHYTCSLTSHFQTVSEG